MQQLHYARIKNNYVLLSEISLINLIETLEMCKKLHTKREI